MTLSAPIDLTRGAVDEDLLPGLDPARVAQAEQGGGRRHRHRRRLLIRQVPRLAR